MKPKVFARAFTRTVMPIGRGRDGVGASFGLSNMAPLPLRAAAAELDWSL